MFDSEREYIELLYRASKKYAAWDPEITVEVGDWGDISKGRECSSWMFWKRRGTFIKYGNIYTDGRAAKYGIPPPKDFGTAPANGVTYVVSNNAQEIGADATALAQVPALAQCNVKTGFKFSSGEGAVLAMNKDTITAVDPAGSLRKLLEDEEMKGCVIVSEVHRCSAYARFLSAEQENTIYIGLSIDIPPANNANVSPEAHWLSSSYVGNFKTKSSQTNDYTPLYRLVSLKEGDTSTGILDRIGLGKGSGPLPDADLPWDTEAKEAGEKKKAARKNTVKTEESKGGVFTKLKKNQGKEPEAASGSK